MSIQKPLSKKEKERIKKMREKLKTASKKKRDGSFKINTKATGMSPTMKTALREQLRMSGRNKAKDLLLKMVAEQTAKKSYKPRLGK